MRIKNGKLYELITLIKSRRLAPCAHIRLFPRLAQYQGKYLYKIIKLQDDKKSLVITSERKWPPLKNSPYKKMEVF